MRKLIFIPIPSEFFGKWAIVTEYGTHGSYTILTQDGMVFETQKQANDYKKEKKLSIYFNVMQIQKSDFPVWQVEMYVAGKV